MRLARPLLGTFVEIAADDGASPETEAAIERAFGAIARVHRLMSFHDPDSDVSRLNREASAGAVAVDRWTYQVLETALDLHRRSAGLFDITVAPILQVTGLLPDAGDDPSPAPMNTRAEEAIELLADNRVRFRYPGVRIDLGGIAKGFAVDRAVEVLRNCGLERGLVNAGGDLAVFGPRPQTVFIRDPRHPRRLMGSVEAKNEALASTGARFDPFQCADALGMTVIDPRTREPARSASGVTVRAPTCMIADALTKVVMIAGESATALLEHYCASALLVLANGEVRISADWQGAVCLAA
jgi:FAD:protein FMN transferase